MSDKYNQIKQTCKIKSILNEAANDWKQLYGCYPTVKEFINLINEHSSVLPNTLNVLVEDRLITSNDISWLCKTIINEQAVGEDKINAWSDKQTEDFINANPGAEEKVRRIRDRYKRAQEDNASAARGERANAERTAAESSGAAEAAEAAKAAETAKTAKDRSAQEAEKAAEAKGRTDRVTPEEVAKATATDWRAQSSDPAERIRQQQASDTERRRARWAARSESKPSVADKIYTAADEIGNKISSAAKTAGRGASTVGKSAVRLPGGLLGAAPMIYGGYKGGEWGEARGGYGGRVAGEVLGSWAGNNATYFTGEMMGKAAGWAASKTIPQGVQNAGKTVAKNWSAIRDKLPWKDVLRVPPKSGPGFTKRNWLSLPGSAGMFAAGEASNWADEQAQEYSPAYKAWAKDNPTAKFATKLAVDLPVVIAGARMGNKASALVAGGAAANWADEQAQEYSPAYKAWGKDNPNAKLATKLPIIGGGAYLGNKALKAAEPTIAKGTALATAVTKKVATKIAPKTAAWAAKTIGPRLGKLVPGIGIPVAGAFIGMGAQRAYAGDPVGGGLEMLSGGAALIPYAGIPISAGLDAVGAYRDASPEEREVVNQAAKDAVNIPKQAAAFARGIVPSGLSVPPQSEDEKQTIRMLDSDNESKNPKRKLQPVNEQRIPPSSTKILEKEILDVLTKKIDTTIAKEIPTYTNHPITVAKPLNPISLPTSAPPTITTTNTSTPTGIQIGTTTFPISKISIPTTPTKAVPTLPATKTDIPTAPTKAVPSLPATKTDTSTMPATKTSTSTLPATKTSTSTLPAVTTKVEPVTNTPIPPRTLMGTLDRTEEDDSGNNTTRLTSILSDPSVRDFDADTERLHARKGVSSPYWDQGSQSYRYISQTVQINEKKNKEYSDMAQESPLEDPGPRLRNTELGGRKGLSMPYWDQASQSYKYISQTVNIQESHSGTLNTKSALQARAKKQKYKVTVMENGKKLEVFATSIRGIRRVVYGKKNFRVHDGKGADITNYFKRLMSSNKSA